MKARGVFRVAAAGRMVRLVAYDEAGDAIAEFTIVESRFRPEMAEQLRALVDTRPPRHPISRGGRVKALRRAPRGLLRLE